MGQKDSTPLTVLYDGRCGMCLRSIRWLQWLDWGKRLRYVNYWDEHERKAIAPHLPLEALDKAMHVVLPDGSSQRGFDAFRRIAWSLPLCWPLLPFLYPPPIPQIGRWVYGKIAERRERCEHGECRVK